MPSESCLILSKYGLLMWPTSFLISNRGMSTVGTGWMLGVFELAGPAGGLGAGWISDLKSQGGRGPVMTAYMPLLSAALVCLWLEPAGGKPVIGMAMAACGFFVYGPLMLVSVTAAGYVGPELAGSASGLPGLPGYIGATLWREWASAPPALHLPRRRRGVRIFAFPSDIQNATIQS